MSCEKGFPRGGRRPNRRYQLQETRWYRLGVLFFSEKRRRTTARRKLQAFLSTKEKPRLLGFATTVAHVVRLPAVFVHGGDIDEVGTRKAVVRIVI